MGAAHSEPLTESLGPSYQAAESAGGNGAKAELDKAWVWRGKAFNLLISVFLLFGQQYVMLIAIAAAVFADHEYLMSCNPYDETIQTNMFVATLCEYTKAHVRCFPLLALLVTMFGTSRVFLYLRVYYQLLKRNILVKFEEYPPYKDPLFLIMVFCMSQAVLHFVLNIITAWHINLVDVKDNVKKAKEEEFQGAVYQLAAFYLIPSVLFFILFQKTYDISELVLPFSKYFDDDEAEVRKDLQTLNIIQEVVAMRTVQYDLVPLALADGRTEADEDEVFAKFSSQASQYKDSGPNLSCWRLSASWWPTRLLLDVRVAGREHASFRLFWMVLSFLFVGIMIKITWYLYVMVIGKIQDIRKGQYNDIAGLVVGLVIIAYVAYLSFNFFRKTIIWPMFGFRYSQDV